jgi:Domain of unknown function (DU1801)
MSVDAVLEKLSSEQQATINALRTVINKNLPKGFAEALSYGMIGYVVPHTLYPKGYHCKPAEPLPFISLAATKTGYSIYHMGIYANKKLYDWFVAEHAKASTKKLDIGKSCIKYKNAADIPLILIGKLVKKISVKDWIATYENAFLKK